jgi:hypothetical protein
MKQFRKNIYRTSNQIITPPDPGEIFGFVRDGSQEEGDPSFHIPRVDYIDLAGNPQVFFPSMTDDICGFIYALSITSTIYCIPCS